MSPRSATPASRERARELDHEHRKRLRGALPLTLSMRYLASAFERLRRGTAPVRARRRRGRRRDRGDHVRRPRDGDDHDAGSRVLVDPLLENSLFGVRRAKAAGSPPRTSPTSTWCW
jgi:hypothetical protein